MQSLLTIVLLPLAGFVFSGLLGKRLPKNITGWISSLTILASFLLSLAVFQQLVPHDAASIKQELFTFIHSGNFHVGFALQADRLTALMMLIVTGIGFLIHVYSISYMHDD